MMDRDDIPVTVALPTLGCKANRYDSDVLARALIARGYVVVPEHGEADVYIVNTCTVTREADAKSRKMLRRSLRRNAEAVVIVTGCAASLDPAQLALDGVAAVVPLVEQARIPELVAQLCPAHLVTTAHGLSASAARTRATVKVQDGCNLRCAFCAVTLARGPVYSRPVDDVIAELRGLVDAGIREIVLTGIRLDAYGLDQGAVRLSDLLDATTALAIPRLRLSSLEPIGITARLADTIAAHPTLCRHFHICLQSGDDGVLRAMRRGYTVARYRRIIALLRAAMPDATFTTDVIVGLPGETDAAFANTCALVEEVGFIKLHIFKYSARPGTAAATMSGQVSDTVKDVRAHELAAIEQRLFRAYGERLLGSEVSVLVERTGRHGNGLTPHYARVEAPFPAALAGVVVPVRVIDVGDDMLYGCA